MYMVILTAVIAFGTLAAAFFAYQSYQLDLMKTISESTISESYSGK
jgi:hypothetical protein